MLRLLFVLIMLPFPAWAEANIPPTLFSFDAAFDACTLDPAQPDLVTHCGETIANAYLLKRAVMRATLACSNTPLATCTAPFEEEGLPAVAMQIALDAGCDTAPPPAGQGLSDNHCIDLAARIMEEEGVVPLDTTLACGPADPECTGLVRLQSYLWQRAITDLSPSETTAERLHAARARCPLGRDRYGCLARAYSEIWADLAPINQ